VQEEARAPFAKPSYDTDDDDNYDVQPKQFKPYSIDSDESSKVNACCDHDHHDHSHS
jgi:hypothetical protein